MTTHTAIGPVMIDLEGPSLSAVEKDKINHPNTGAVILFSRNYREPDQIAALVADIRAARNGPLLIAVDQEGGRVQRFKQGFTRLPSASSYVNRPELAEAAGWLMAAELLAVGVDFSFAPVLDVDCGISEIIGNRAFSEHAEAVARLAGAFRKGMQRAGMAATGKHFPGHGAVAADSHLALPVDERTLDELRTKDLIPFKRLIEDGLEGIMPAHVLFPNIDSQPAGFSTFWIQTVLRGELHFNGTVFSDDLSMEGAAGAGTFAERANLALAAGCDMVLVCNNPAAAEQVLEEVPIIGRPLGARRLEAMRGKPALSWEQLHASEQWRSLSTRISELAHDYD